MKLRPYIWPAFCYCLAVVFLVWYELYDVVR